MSLSLSRRAKLKKGIFYLLLAGLLPLSYQCVKMPLEPKMPTWTTQLTIPLFDRSWTFADMIKKDSKFDTTSDIGVIYRPTSVKNNPTAIDIPPLNPAQGQVTNKLGVVPLDIPTLPGFSSTFEDMFGVAPPATPYPGNDTSVAITRDVVGDSATYDWMRFENGTMTLTITNSFPFGVSFPSGVDLVNSSDDSVVAHFDFPGVIPPNSTQQASSDLAGKRMDALMKMNFTVQTDQINGKTIQSTDNLSASMSITNSGLTSAKVKLTGDYPLVNVQDSVQKLDDSTGIFRAEFNGGSFDIKIINDIDTKIVVAFTLNEFLDKTTGQPFKLKEATHQDNNGVWIGDGATSDSVVIERKSTYDMPVLMKDYVLQSKDINLSGDTLSTKVIHFSLSIKTLVHTNDKRVISKDDSVVAAIIPNQADNDGKYTLSYVRGKLKPTPSKIHFEVPVTIGDIGNKFTSDSLTFDSVTIAVNILSTGLFPTDMKMTIYALDNNGDVGDSLVVPYRPDTHPSSGYAQRIEPGDSAQILFTKGTGVSRFLGSFFGRTGRLPDKLLVAGDALIDPVDVYLDSLSTGTVQDGDSIYTSVNFSFPVRLGIVNGVLRDTIRLGEQNIDKKTYSNVETGNIYFKIENGFPFRLNVSADMFKALATDSSQIDTNSLLITLPRGADSTTGRLADPPIIVDSSAYFSGGGEAKSYTYISLVPADVEKITSADFMTVRIRMKTSGNSGEPVLFQTSDFLHMKIFANVSYNVDFSDNKK